MEIAATISQSLLILQKKNEKVTSTRNKVYQPIGVDFWRTFFSKNIPGPILTKLRLPSAIRPRFLYHLYTSHSLHWLHCHPSITLSSPRSSSWTAPRANRDPCDTWPPRSGGGTAGVSASCACVDFCANSSSSESAAVYRTRIPGAAADGAGVHRTCRTADRRACARHHRTSASSSPAPRKAPTCRNCDVVVGTGAMGRTAARESLEGGIARGEIMKVVGLSFRY